MKSFESAIRLTGPARAASDPVVYFTRADYLSV